MSALNIKMESIAKGKYSIYSFLKEDQIYVIVFDNMQGQKFAEDWLKNLSFEFLTMFAEKKLVAIFDEMKKNQMLKDMGLFLLKLENKKLCWLSTGTLRLYLYREESLGRITNENLLTTKLSWENANENKKQKTPNDILERYNTGNIIGEIGTISDFLHNIDANVKPFSMQNDDMLILTSKELYVRKDDEDLEKVLDDFGGRSEKKVFDLLLQEVDYGGEEGFALQIVRLSENGTVQTIGDVAKKTAGTFYTEQNLKEKEALVFTDNTIEKRRIVLKKRRMLKMFTGLAVITLLFVLVFIIWQKFFS